MSEHSPTGFTYREKSWLLIDPKRAPRKVVLAGLREARHEGFSNTTGHGGTAAEVRSLLAAAQERKHKNLRESAKQAVVDVGGGVTAAEANDFLASLPLLEPL